MQPIIKTVLKFVYKFNCLNLDILWKSNEKKNKYWKQKIAASFGVVCCEIGVEKDCCCECKF